MSLTFSQIFSTMTEMKNQNASGQTIEVEGGGVLLAEERDSLSAKPLGAPISSIQNGASISSRSMRSKVACREKRQNRTIKGQKLVERTTEQQRNLQKISFVFSQDLTE